jgi:hypothetical protein
VPLKPPHWIFGLLASLGPVWTVLYAALLSVQVPDSVSVTAAPMAPYVRHLSIAFVVCWMMPAFGYPVLLLIRGVSGKLTWLDGTIVGGAIARWRSYNVAIVAACAGLAWVAVYFAPWLWPLRYRGAEQCTKRGAEIIDAIEQFRAARGEYPAQLRQLVPEYLSRIPTPGALAYPEFVYKRADGRMPFPKYELSVPMSHGLSFDELVYWPGGGYTPRVRSGATVAIGTWVYIRD